MSFNYISTEFSKAHAEQVGDDIIYGCDEKAMRWHNRLMKQELKNLKPKWIHGFIWNKLINKTKDGG